jgi:hypothetical protein
VTPELALGIRCVKIYLPIERNKIVTEAKAELTNSLRGRFSRPLYAVRPAPVSAQRALAHIDETTLTAENAKTILSRNDSPDIGFDRSVNPYRGCEHGCIYCFARPTHAYLGLSPGLDFETKLFFKPEAANLLRKELSKPGYAPERVQLGANTDSPVRICRARLHDFVVGNASGARSDAHP